MLTVLQAPQAQEDELEGACRTKDEQLAVRDTENQQQAAAINSMEERIRYLEVQLQKTEVYQWCMRQGNDLYVDGL